MEPQLLEVGSGVFFVEASHTNFVLLCEGDDLTLVDSGYPKDRRLLESSVRQTGHDLSDLSAMLLTHAHVDHLGSAEWLRRDHHSSSGPSSTPTTTGRGRRWPGWPSATPRWWSRGTAVPTAPAPHGPSTRRPGHEGTAGVPDSGLTARPVCTTRPEATVRVHDRPEGTARRWHHPPLRAPQSSLAGAWATCFRGSTTAAPETSGLCESTPGLGKALRRLGCRAGEDAASTALGAPALTVDDSAEARRGAARVA